MMLTVAIVSIATGMLMVGYAFRGGGAPPHHQADRVLHLTTATIKQEPPRDPTPPLVRELQP